jgi:hypothetical protein
MTHEQQEKARHTRRRRSGKRCAIFTSTPEVDAPALDCPTCHAVLEYRQTVISGVKPIERWDCFECSSCGPYVYRQRTRTLRQDT